jgi:hypothetical protein
MSMLATRPRTVGPSIHRLGGLTLWELHDNTGLPGCFIEELLMNDFRPDTSWSKDLPCAQTAKQVLNAYDVVTRDQRFTPQNSQPYVCYHTTVILYQKQAWKIGDVVELARYDLEPRTWPRTSFVERGGELWEVTGGRVFYAGDAWWWEHFCYRNTELARHFSGQHGFDVKGEWRAECIPCRQMDFLKTYGHGNYGTCERCGQIFALCPSQVLGPVIPRHKCVDGIVPEAWPEKILEPLEAKGRVHE